MSRKGSHVCEKKFSRCREKNLMTLRKISQRHETISASGKRRPPGRLPECIRYACHEIAGLAEYGSVREILSVEQVVDRGR